MTLEQCWGLARRWYDGRLDASWRGLSPERAGALFASVGLTGEFWRMT